MTPGSATAELVVDCKCELGEGVTWDASAERLMWLDVDGQVFHTLATSGTHRSLPLDRRVSALVPAAAGGLVGVAGLDILRFDDDGTAGAVIASLPADGDGLANDARCDPLGRLWVGTVDRSGQKLGGLFCVTERGTITKIRSGVELSNGMDWSPDGSRCYYVDTLARCIQTIHLDADGSFDRTETLVDIAQMPDGLSVDCEGAVWVALWDGAAVHRYTPDGTLDRVVNVEAGFVSNCAFGGATGTTLYVTTARSGLSDSRLASEPTAGGLFAIDVGIAGRGYTPFGPTQAEHRSN